MAQKTNGQLTTEAEVIQNETTPGANTADRIGEMLIDIIDSKKNNDEYKVYTALLSQSSNNPPVATVLKNTIGTITLQYESPGVYQITSSGLFTNDKTWLTSVIYVDDTSVNRAVMFRNSSSLIRVKTIDTSGNEANDLLFNNSIEIRVYP